MYVAFFFASRRRHTRSLCDWSSDVCSSDLELTWALNFRLRRSLPRNRSVSPRMRILVELALAMGLLVPVALAQKPPAPAPAPAPPAPPSHPATPTPSSTPPGQPREDLVMFLLGRVATDDGTPVPHDMLVERVCNASVRQQVYATSRGDFSMELGSMTDSYLDASGDRSPQYGQSSKVPGTGISRLELTNCELRATVSGFYSSVISLVD